MSIDTIEEVNKSIDTIEHVQKFNPYHGKDGRFASKNGGGAGAGAAGAMQNQADKNNGRAKQTADAVGYKEISGTLSSKKVKEAKERGGYLGEVNGKSYLISPQANKTITVYTGTKTKSGGLNMEKYITGIKNIGDAQDWGRGTILNEGK